MLDVLYICCVLGVFYVDTQRNMAVTMGERDVKLDVKEKSRRDKYLASALMEGDTAESYIGQVGRLGSGGGLSYMLGYRDWPR